MSNALILFNPKLPKLSKNERQVLDLLVAAGKLIAPLYLEQEKQAAGISRAEIEKAGKKDPSFLSPYTVVEKIDGKLAAIPYHVKYATLLKPVADKLNQAAEITENKEFGKALQIQAKALLDGSYEKVISTWLAMKPYILDISIGPVVYFDEQLFYGKASYQAWVGVLNEERTKRLELYKKIALTTDRKTLISRERMEQNHNVKTRVDNVLLFSGLMARTKFIGVNFPNNLQWVEKYGSEIFLFENANDSRMEEQIMPAFNKFFSAEFRQSFEREDLRRASLRYVALHEIAHSYLYYKNAFAKLQDLLPVLYELSATVLGLKIAGSLLVKDIITDKQLESMFVTFMCRSFYLIEQYKKTKFMGNYALGGVLFINFMLEMGALKQHKGLAILNFIKMFVLLHDLFYVLEKLLSSGTRKDAENFVKKYGNLKNLL